MLAGAGILGTGTEAQAAPGNCRYESVRKTDATVTVFGTRAWCSRNDGATHYYTRITCNLWGQASNSTAAFGNHVRVGEGTYSTAFCGFGATVGDYTVWSYQW